MNRAHEILMKLIEKNLNSNLLKLENNSNNHFIDLEIVDKNFKNFDKQINMLVNNVKQNLKVNELNFTQNLIKDAQNSINNTVKKVSKLTINKLNQNNNNQIKKDNNNNNNNNNTSKNNTINTSKQNSIQSTPRKMIRSHTSYNVNPSLNSSNLNNTTNTSSIHKKNTLGSFLKKPTRNNHPNFNNTTFTQKFSKKKLLLTTSTSSSSNNNNNSNRSFTNKSKNSANKIHQRNFTQNKLRLNNIMINETSKSGRLSLNKSLPNIHRDKSIDIEKEICDMKEQIRRAEKSINKTERLVEHKKSYSFKDKGKFKKQKSLNSSSFNTINNNNNNNNNNTSLNHKNVNNKSNNNKSFIIPQNFNLKKYLKNKEDTLIIFNNIMKFLPFKENFFFSQLSNTYFKDIIIPFTEEYVSNTEPVLNKEIEYYTKTYPKECSQFKKNFFSLSRGSLKAIVLLNDELYTKIFYNNNLEGRLLEIVIIYRILACLLKKNEILKIKSDKVFWGKICDWLLEERNVKLGEFLKNESKKFNFNNDNIKKLKKLTQNVKDKISPNYYSKVCGTTGLVVFIVKDALEFCGVIVNEKKTPVKSLYNLKKMEYLDLIHIKNKILPKLKGEYIEDDNEKDDEENSSIMTESFVNNNNNNNNNNENEAANNTLKENNLINNNNNCEENNINLKTIESNNNDVDVMINNEKNEINIINQNNNNINSIINNNNKNNENENINIIMKIIIIMIMIIIIMIMIIIILIMTIIIMIMKIIIMMKLIIKFKALFIIKKLNYFIYKIKINLIIYYLFY